MSTFELTVLGSSSALPAGGRNPSAHVLNIQERFYLIDCGEGTQMQMRRYGQKIQKMESIFISHLHGDHYFGLPGLLGTMHLLGRVKPLNIYAPEGLQEILELQHHHSETFLKFPLHFHTLRPGESYVCYETEKIIVSTIPLQHRVPCCGFLFREKTRRDKATRSFAYCSDTKFSKDVIEKVKGVDFLYHEATFTEEHKEKAIATFHSTAREAGLVAKEAAVKFLLIGHFSARYDNTDVLAREAAVEFEACEAAVEGKTYTIGV